MAGIHRYEEIEARQKARELTRELYRLTGAGCLAGAFPLRDPFRRPETMEQDRHMCPVEDNSSNHMSLPLRVLVFRRRHQHRPRHAPGESST